MRRRRKPRDPLEALWAALLGYGAQVLNEATEHRKTEAAKRKALKEPLVVTVEAEDVPTKEK